MKAIFEIRFRDSGEVKRIEADLYQEAYEGFISFYKDFEGVGLQQMYMVRLSEILSVERVPEIDIPEMKIPEEALEDLARKIQGGQFV